MNTKIFGIGLPKTGTSSLHAAMEILGYRSVHYPVTWLEINNCEVASDISIACRFEELDRLYPNSKFILTVRDLEQWLQSCQYHFEGKVNPLKLAPCLQEFLLAQRLLAFGTTSYKPILFQQAYERHLQQIQDYFANRQQDLLIVNITQGEGWDSLCPFVGLPKPNKPFPHQNIACQSLEKMFQDMTVKLERNIGDWLS